MVTGEVQQQSGERVSSINEMPEAAHAIPVAAALLTHHVALLRRLVVHCLGTRPAIARSSSRSPPRGLASTVAQCGKRLPVGKQAAAADEVLPVESSVMRHLLRTAFLSQGRSSTSKIESTRSALRCM